LDTFLEDQSIQYIQDDAPVGKSDLRVCNSSGISCQTEDNSANVQDSSAILHGICHEQVVVSRFKIYIYESHCA
jgi:hypothetical protein